MGESEGKGTQGLASCRALSRAAFKCPTLHIWVRGASDSRSCFSCLLPSSLRVQILPCMHTCVLLMIGTLPLAFMKYSLYD
jgi:hypothetical protein